jgi:hypothetical protein
VASDCGLKFSRLIKKEKKCEKHHTQQVQTKTSERREVLTAVLLRIQVSLDVMVLLGEFYSGFLGMQYLYLRVKQSKGSNSPSFNHTLLEMLDPENEGTIILHNVQNYSPIKTVSHSRGPESSSINNHTCPKI